MPSATPSPSSVSAPTSNSTRSLLSRIKTPFAAKPRNIFEFNIQPDDPHRQYSPGDVVSGSVILKVVKPVRITHLSISLHGYVQVFKNPNSSGDVWRSYQTMAGLGKGKKAGISHGIGCAPLFEDERVLCGEGRLTESIYHFNFELMFPQKRLPSSIDFERGTVSYQLTATLTRPTTISPTTTCERKIYLIETIDIASLFEPSPKFISLEPKNTRSRVRVKRKPPGGESKSLDSPDASDQGKSRVSELSSVDENEAPNSPAPSDVSFDTQVSVTTGSMEEGTQFSTRTGDAGRSKKSVAANSTPRKPITAKVELLKAGFLRGDHIPLKITVKHTKYIKSLHGIIVTLYRRATVDMHPAPSMIKKDPRTGKSEDYMPRSRTGLGGLSLSSSGSSHTFRKDLAQSFAPLIIDPRTLSAEIKVSVRVPDEAFPTISSVPSAMLSFRYYVEVVVDLQGKLAGLGRFLPNSGMLSMPSGYPGNGAVPGRPEDASGTILAAWGSNFLDTSQIRRDKTVAASLFEIIVGTKDSARKSKGKAKDDKVPKNSSAEDATVNVHESPFNEGFDLPDYQRQHSYNSNQQQHNYYDYEGYHPEDAIYQHDHYYDNAHGYGQQDQPPEFPIPTALLAEEAALPEKERLQRHADRLLPSAPPQDDPHPTSASASASASASVPPSSPLTAFSTSSSTAATTTPSAPTTPYHQTTPSRTASVPHAHALTPVVSGQDDITVPSAPLALDSFSDAMSRASVAPVPAYEIHAASHETRIDAGPTMLSEDKEEARRKVLEHGRSAPPLADDDADDVCHGDRHDEGDGEAASGGVIGVRGGASGPLNLVPSAPAWEDVEGSGNISGGRAGREREGEGEIGPPRYER